MEDKKGQDALLDNKEELRQLIYKKLPQPY